MNKPKFNIGDHVAYDGLFYYVHGLAVCDQSAKVSDGKTTVEYGYYLGLNQPGMHTRPDDLVMLKEEKKIKTAKEQIEWEIKETAHYYGGWDEFKKVIQRLEENDNEAAYERMQNNA